METIPTTDPRATFSRNLLGIPSESLELFVQKISPDPVTGCWNWTACLTSCGYGGLTMLAASKTSLRAHRLAYQLAVGEVPEGWHVHHTCENRKCCNPAHLVAVSLRTHLVELTPSSVSYIHAHKTHCPHGHPYDAENTGFYPQGDRYCRKCKAEVAKRRYQRWRAAHPYARIHGDKCPEGHDLSLPENLRWITKSGKRYRSCRLCYNNRVREWARKRREARGAATPPVPRTHCKNGHEYTPENSRREADGRLRCKICAKEYLRKWHEKKRQEQQQKLAA